MSAAVALTPSQISNLTTTPVLVVAGVTGYYLSVLDVVYILENNTVGWTVDSGTDFAVSVGPSVGGSTNQLLASAGQVVGQGNNFLDTPASGLSAGTTAQVGDVDGVGIFINAIDGTDAQGGDGTLRVIVSYILVPLN